MKEQRHQLEQHARINRLVALGSIGVIYGGTGESEVYHRTDATRRMVGVHPAELRGYG